MQDITEIKQLLLQKEIFEKNFNIDHFADFMEEMKPGGGSDIDIWSLEELNKAVNDYQLKFAEEIPQEKQPSKLEQYIQMRPDLCKSIYYIKQSHLKGQEDNNFFKIIECKDIIPNMLTQVSNVHIEIRNFEKKPGTMFSSSFIIYRVVTQPLGWEVQRRYTDFTWLREYLVKQYPGQNVPPIPRKSQTRNYQDIYLIKRMKFLEKFLNKILKCKELANDRCAEAFLQLQDEKAFKQVVQDSTKIPKSQKLDQLVHEDHQVTLALNPEINNFMRNSSDYLNNLDFLFKKVRKQSKQLMLDYDNVANTMFGLGETFAQLYNVSNGFNRDVQNSGVFYNGIINIQLQSQDEMFITLNNMMISWGNVVQNQVKEVQESLCHFFKFYHHELMSTKEYMKQREQAQNEFEKFKSRLDLKKDKLFQSGDVKILLKIQSQNKKQIGRFELSPQVQKISKNELLENKKVTMLLMLPKETNSQMELRDIYAYYSNVSVEEMTRIQHQNIGEWAAHFQEFCKNQSDQVTQLHMLWADSLTIMQAFGKQQESKQLSLMIIKQTQQQNSNNLEESQVNM